MKDVLWPPLTSAFDLRLNICEERLHNLVLGRSLAPKSYPPVANMRV